MRRARAPHPLVADAEFALDRRRAAAACAGPRGRSAITTATTRCATTTRCSTSTQLARRRDAIYPATVVGKPRQEDFFIGDLLQELLSPLFPLVMPAVETSGRTARPATTRSPRRSCSERYAREAMARAFRILGEGQLSLTKFLLVTDRTVDLQRLPRHARARARAHASRDRPLRLLEPVDGHARLHRPGRSTRARRACGSGSAIRCASCRASSGRRRRRRPTSPTCASSAAAAWSSAARRTPTTRDAAARLAAHPAFAGWPLVVLTDEPRARRGERR